MITVRKEVLKNVTLTRHIEAERRTGRSKCCSKQEMKGSCEELCSAMSRRDIARREKVERDGKVRIRGSIAWRLWSSLNRDQKHEFSYPCQILFRHRRVMKTDGKDSGGTRNSVNHSITSQEVREGNKIVSLHSNLIL